jgi:hypothetical protein
MSDPLTFTASIAPLQSAIRIASDGGARVSLDIPESEMPAIVRLVLYRNVVLRVTIEEVQQGSTNGSAQTKRRAKRSPLDLAGG